MDKKKKLSNNGLSDLLKLNMSAIKVFHINMVMSTFMEK